MLVAIVSGQATGAVPIQESNASFVISTFENSGLEVKGYLSLRQGERGNIPQ